MATIAQQKLAASRQAARQRMMSNQETARAKKAAKAEAKANKGKFNYATEGTRYLDAQQAILDKTIGLESQFRPQFGAQNLADIGQYSAGLQEILGQSTRTAQDQLAASKAAEIESMTSLTGKTRSFLDSISPEQSAMVRQATDAANRAYSMSGTLTPDQMRSSTQFARESAGQAGRVGGNADISAQILNREQMLGARRAEAAGAGQQAYGLAQSMYQQPTLNLLGQPSQAYNAGQQANVYGMGLLGQSTPQMINPDTGINLGMAERQDANALRMAKLQADAAKKAGKSAMVGNIIGGIGGGLTKLFTGGI